MERSRVSFSRVVMDFWWRSTQFPTALTQHVHHGCISTDIISSDLSDANSFHQHCCSIMPVTACYYRLQQSVPNIPVSFCYIRLIQHWQTNRLFHSDTVSSEQYVGINSLIQLWYHTCWRQQAVTVCGVFACVEGNPKQPTSRGQSWKRYWCKGTYFYHARRNHTV